MNWDDFQTIKVLAETRSVRGAASVLGVNPSTVTRRLEHLETALGVLLFTRSPQGLHPTQELISIQHEIDAVGTQIGEITSHLQGFNQRLEGKVRFAVPDALALAVLLGGVQSFSQRYPHIDLEIVPGYQNRDIAGGEVDVAIRATDSPPDNLVGRPLMRVGLAAYASKAFAQQHGLIDLPERSVCELEGLPWLDWAANGEVMDWYRRIQAEYYPSAHIHIRCDHVHMHSVLMADNVAAGVLPCFVGDSHPDLVRLPNAPVTPGPMLWLLSHPDLRAARRVHVFLEFVTNLMQENEATVTGVATVDAN